MPTGKRGILRAIPNIAKVEEGEVVQLKKRLDFVTAVILVLMSALVFRLWFLQIYQGDKYKDESEKNRVRTQSIAAPRGNIVDRNNQPIVANRPSFNVVWTREDAPNPDEVIKNVAALLGKDISEIYEKLRDAIDMPRYMPLRIAEDIDWKTLVAIENNHIDLPGIRIEVVATRDYLHGNMASHMIGYLREIDRDELKNLEDKGYVRGDIIGKMGVEKIFEESLRGQKGKRYVEVDVHGFEQQEIKVIEPLPGHDLKLTIDINLQIAGEKAFEGKSGGAAVLEVQTGRVLALISSPQLSLKEFASGLSAKAWNVLKNDPMFPLMNKSIQGTYPPGSTYKIVTALAGLSSGVVNEDTAFFCSGTFSFGNRKYGCWKKEGHGSVSLHRALAESCDVYFYQVGLKLGVDRLAAFANSIGLGVTTGIDLENERAGVIPTAAWKLKTRREPWQEGETVSIAIGQGFDTATPLQIARMMATVANGGILYRPQIVEASLDETGNPAKVFAPVELGRISNKPKHLQFVRNALVAAVNEKHGTGGKAKLKDILVGGKTGTAQVIRLKQNHKKTTELELELPYKERDHAWFTCFAPAEKPEIAVAVLVEHGGHGGPAAGPIAKAILMQYFGIRPGENDPAKPAEPSPQQDED